MEGSSNVSSCSMGRPINVGNQGEESPHLGHTGNGHLEKPLRVKNSLKKMKNLGKVSSFADDRSTSSSSSSNRARLVAVRRRNSKLLAITSSRRKLCALCNDVEAVALPLGMSMATLFAQVLDKNNKAWNQIPPDRLSTMCCSAVRESLSNVFGDKFDVFSNNFERSFRSTLRTISLINEQCQNDGSVVVSSQFEMVSSQGDETVRNCIGDSDAQSYIVEQGCVIEDREDMRSHSVDNYMAEHDPQSEHNQLICCPSSMPRVSNQFSLIEKSVIEQARSNDLKSVEIGLARRKLKLKEAQLALDYDSNCLQRSKLVMGESKANFQAEKFKTQQEDTKHLELRRTIMDCFVAGLFIMSALLFCGAYVFSYTRISDATASCTNLHEESKSWWMPKQVTSFNSGWNILRCQVQVYSRMVFGMLMIMAIAYLLLQRSGGSQQTMPVTFILLLLGVVCGVAGKLCVDTLGGSGLLWALCWEILCLSNFLSVIFTPALFSMLYGSVTASQRTKSELLAPFWIRRLLYFALQLVVMPLCCGLLPFASLGEWLVTAMSFFTEAGVDE